MPRSDQSRWWRGAEALLAASLVVLPWSLGGAAWWAAAALSGLSSGAVLLWAAGAIRNHRRWEGHPLLWLPLFMVAGCAVQLLPLPPLVLNALSPSAEELRRFALEPLGISGWRPVSLDPPSTLRVLSRIAALGATSFVALQLGRTEEVRRRLLALQVLVGVGISLTGFAHLLAGADSLFGVHQFTATLGLQTPFGNTNHLAAFLSLTAIIAVGLAVTAPSRDATLGWGLAALSCGVGVFLSYSRGGVGVFVLTSLVVATMFVAQRAGGVKTVLPWVIIAATVLLAGLFSFEQLVARAETLSTLDKVQRTKIELWPMMMDGLVHAWRTGFGAGAFELAFTRWQTMQPEVTFTHPENLILQLVSDWGGVGALLILVAGLSMTWRTWRAVRHHALERTVLLGVVGTLAHDLFDFSLELPAVAVAAAAACGLVISAGGAAAPRRRGGWRVLVVAAATALVGAGALWAAGEDHLSAEKRLGKAIAERRPVSEVRAVGIAAINSHPADWVLYAQIAADLSQRAEPLEGLAWVNRVLFLRPLDRGSHLAAARSLLRLGKPLQALAEFKTAWALGDVTSLELGVSIALKQQALDRLLIDQPGHLTRLWSVLRARETNTDAAALLAAVEMSAVSEGVQEEARLLLVRHESELGDPAKALSALDDLPPHLKELSGQQEVRVRLLDKLGRPAEARAVLERLAAREPSRVELALWLSESLAVSGRLSDARMVLERARPFVSAPEPRSRLFALEAALLIREERWSRALDALQTASRLVPTSAQFHYQSADVLERMGSLSAALEEVRAGKLVDTPEGAAAHEGVVRRLEAALLSGVQ